MMEKILDAYDVYRSGSGWKPQDVILRQHVQTRPGLRHHQIDWRERGQVLAEVNHGRWIARCPYCAGAMYVAPGLPFYCVDCLMVSNEGQAMTVVFPEEKERIEALLLARPLAARNWQPGETVAQLESENDLYGGEPWHG
ncbi:MAG TPA: hypothetical protein PK801_14955 [Aggregatilineales bacterium]|nr:hypothetical protein [Aggregatilineales bacterium]